MRRPPVSGLGRRPLTRALLRGGLLSAILAQTPSVRAQSQAERRLRTRRAELRVETVARVEHPWGLAFLGEDRFLVTERNKGQLRLGQLGGSLSAPIAGVPDTYRYEGPNDRSQGGLFDVVLHPRFDENRTIFLSHSRWTEKGGGTAVTRARLVEGDAPRLEDVRNIFMMNNPDGSGLHFGGRMVFEPGGDALLLTVGDRRDMSRAQDPSDHAGSILRMTAEGEPAPGNPFAQDSDKAAHLYAMGLRNVQGMGFDAETGVLWVTDHGPLGGDEIHRIEAGKNYGWPHLTGGRDYSGAAVGGGSSRDGMEAALHIFEQRVAPSGLAVYRGDTFPEWQGDLLHGGLHARALIRTRIANGRVTEEEWMLRDLDRRIRDVAVHPDGSVWLLTEHAQGEVLRLTAA